MGRRVLCPCLGHLGSITAFPPGGKRETQLLHLSTSVQTTTESSNGGSRSCILHTTVKKCPLATEEEEGV